MTNRAQLREKEQKAYATLDMDETETRRDVITEDHDMRIQECPSLGAGCIIELEAIKAIVEFDVKDEGLVAILQ